MNPSTSPTPTLVGWEGWRDSAACLGTDLDVFFPENQGRDPYRRARAICSDCPVSDECLEAEMKFEGNAPVRLRAGMRGGLTPEGRLELHRLRTELGTAAS